MPKFVAAQYVVHDLPPPEMIIRAIDDEGTIWWLDENCSQGDWLEFVAQGGSVMAAKTEPPPRKGKRK